MTWTLDDAQQHFQEIIAELRQLCLEENYTFEIPPRQNRPDPFADLTP